MDGIKEATPLPLGGAYTPDDVRASMRDGPDLTDPATQGCLLAMLREVEPMLDASVMSAVQVVVFEPDDSGRVRFGVTAPDLGSALALALLRAHGEEEC